MRWLNGLELVLIAELDAGQPGAGDGLGRPLVHQRDHHLTMMMVYLELRWCSSR
jgi:hypothetical protein